MKYTDVHVHAHSKNPGITSKKILKTMDEVGLEKMALTSWYGRDIEEQKNNIEEVASIISDCPERLYGLAWIEPRHNTPLEMLEWAINKGYQGFKMIPNKWYPYEEKIIVYCEKMASLNVPCLFHSGILYLDTLSSRCCQPVYFEELLKIPNFRFALAHISWPWTDECLALLGEAVALKKRGMCASRMFIDITPGTPPDYRAEALRRLVTFAKEEAREVEDSILFGTDLRIDRLEDFKKRIQTELNIYEKLNFSREIIEKICYNNFHKFFGINNAS